MSDGAQLLVFLAFAFSFVVGAIALLFTGRKDERFGDTWLGTVHGLEIASVWDKKTDRRLVSLTVEDTSEDQKTERCAYLTPAEARRLAGLLRIAAAPGKTLAEARRSMRAAAAAKTPPEGVTA